jgi:hypothetical protein
MVDELWKPIVEGFGLYLISNEGRIKKMAFVDRNGRSHKEQIIRADKDWAGYQAVTLRGRNKEAVKRRVHVMVAEAFLGDRPQGLDVCHNDSNTLNNRLDNLRYDTRRGNFADKLVMGTDNRGEKHHQHKLTEHSVESIRTLRKGGASLDSISWLFGVAPSTVSQIANGVRWKHLP